MIKTDYPQPIRDLVTAFKRLPSVGPKSAERITLWLMRQQQQLAGELAVALANALQQTQPCPECGFFMDVASSCVLCSATDRDGGLLCVVEQPSDILPLDKTGAFAGYYHVLGGKMSPLDGIGPEQLRIQPLLTRLRSGNVKEVILAMGSDVEGEATANYLAEMIRPLQIAVSRLAQGLPAGGGLEQADELTLFRAMQGRRKVD